MRLLAQTPGIFTAGCRGIFSVPQLPPAPPPRSNSSLLGYSPLITLFHALCPQTGQDTKGPVRQCNQGLPWMAGTPTHPQSISISPSLSLLPDWKKSATKAPAENTINTANNNWQYLLSVHYADNNNDHEIIIRVSMIASDC